MTIGPERIAASVGIAVRKLTLWLSGKESTIATSPTLSAGTGAASSSEPNGSLYLRTNGDVSQRISDAWVTPLSGGRAANLATAATAKSTVITGTGSPQNFAHGFGTTPTRVMVTVYSGHNGSGAAGTQMPTVTEGTHDATNCVVTVTAGATYVVHALR